MPLERPSFPRFHSEGLVLTVKTGAGGSSLVSPLTEYPPRHMYFSCFLGFVSSLYTGYQAKSWFPPTPVYWLKHGYQAKGYHQDCKASGVGDLGCSMIGLHLRGGRRIWGVKGKLQNVFPSSSLRTPPRGGEGTSYES